MWLFDEQGLKQEASFKGDRSGAQNSPGGHASG